MHSAIQQIGNPRYGAAGAGTAPSGTGVPPVWWSPGLARARRPCHYAKARVGTARPCESIRMTLKSGDEAIPAPFLEFAVPPRCAVSPICHRLGVLLAFLVAFARAVCGRAEPSISETRLTLEKWVETRQLISKTRSDWQSDKELIDQTTQLFQRELKSVEEQMAKLGTNSVQVDKERAEAEALKTSSAQALDRARQFAAGFEVQLRNLVPRLPAPLQEILKPALSRIPADANTRMTMAERMQVIVGILNELDKFNNAVSVFSEKRKNQKGEEVAVETVYVGLGAAYFVNAAGDFAGTGAPGPSGWEWTPKPELAASVRDVIRIYRNERPATFISLPATIR